MKTKPAEIVIPRRNSTTFTKVPMRKESSSLKFLLICTERALRSLQFFAADSSQLEVCRQQRNSMMKETNDVTDERNFFRREFPRERGRGNRAAVSRRIARVHHALSGAIISDNEELCASEGARTGTQQFLRMKLRDVLTARRPRMIRAGSNNRVPRKV